MIEKTYLILGYFKAKFTNEVGDDIVRCEWFPRHPSYPEQEANDRLIIRTFQDARDHFYSLIAEQRGRPIANGELITCHRDASYVRPPIMGVTTGFD